MAAEAKGEVENKAGENAEVCRFCGRSHGRDEACLEQVMACNQKTVGEENTVRVGC